jgi:hypothetical protein
MGYKDIGNVEIIIKQDGRDEGIVEKVARWEGYRGQLKGRGFNKVVRKEG